jgi:hypothetical protein
MSNTVDQDRRRRRRQAQYAITTLRIEGLELSGEGSALLEGYASGELTPAEFGRAVDEFHDRKFGPVRLSRNEHP